MLMLTVTCWNERAYVNLIHACTVAGRAQCTATEEIQ